MGTGRSQLIKFRDKRTGCPKFVYSALQSVLTIRSDPNGPPYLETEELLTVPPEEAARPEDCINFTYRPRWSNSPRIYIRAAIVRPG